MDVYRVTYHSRGEEESQWVSTQMEAEALSSKLLLEEGYMDSKIDKLRVPLESEPDLLDWLNLYAYRGV